MSGKVLNDSCSDKKANLDKDTVPKCQSSESKKMSETKDETKLLLCMHKSNQVTDDGLDIMHVRGGETSPKEDDAKTSSKRRRLSIGWISDDILYDDSLRNDMTPDDAYFDNDDESYNSNEVDIYQDLSEDSTQQASVVCGDSKYTMEFDILDEIEATNDPDEVQIDDDSDDSISNDEIDAMLEAELQNHQTGKGQGGAENDLDHENREKVILKVRGQDHFDVLPEGWIEVTHNSGMPIYLHKQSRVCSASKPYFLGPGSTRKHEIPISAVPCLHYSKELEKERIEKEEQERTEKENTTENSSVNKSENVFPSAKLESVKENKMSRSLDYLTMREYCQKRFEFQTITVKRFKTWSGRRKHHKMMKQKQRPSLPENTKLITCPLPPAANMSTTIGNNSKREFIMNPSGKSSVCILHEYVQHTLRLQPKYIFKEMESASTPYGAVVVINNMEYGSGYGSSKKQAKSEAAKAALEVLIPKMRTVTSDGKDSEEELQDVKYFDEVRVEDPRVCDLSVKAGQPYPYQILLECLKRNYGMGDTAVQCDMKNLKHQKNEFQMTVGKHFVSVVCKNKKDGKHRASQAILQLLHPHINSWGSLLRMYGKGSCKTLKQKKEDEQKITELQSKACVNRPNMSILNKLKEEMLKYALAREAQKPIGKLIPEKMDLLTTSDSNLKNVEL